MGQAILSIKYAKNTGAVFSAAELKAIYFTGIALEDQYGNPIDQTTIDLYIEAAQKEIQDYLSVKLARQAYEESKDFMYDDWIKWGYITTTYPVVTALELKGYLNTILQLSYPTEWLSAKRSTDEDLLHRQISLVPARGSTNVMSGSSAYIGITPLLGQWGNKTVPNYWNIRYITGFKKVPADILNHIGKMAAINVLLLLGDIISGVPGVASKSIGIDSLSQSTTTTASSGKTAFAGRIEAYRRELDRQLPLMKGRYCGFIFGVLG